MEIIAIGLNYKTAPVEIRERLAFSEPEIRQALSVLSVENEVAECAILSTCNRTEIYALAAGAEPVRQPISRYLCGLKGLPFSALEPLLYVYQGQDAVLHLFHVAAGLDSMILGETQILGQVKQAYEQAVSCGTVGKVLHALFRQALVCGKRVHTETEINQSAASVSYAAVKLAREICSPLERCRILVIGAGKMSELALKHLQSQGVQEIMIINRTRERAEKLAGKFSGSIYDYSRMGDCLQRADIVISSTGAPHMIVKKPAVASIMRVRKNRPLFLIDIAVPRDLDPAINELDNVYLYDIDDLQKVVSDNLKEREMEARKAELIAGEAAAEFQIWFKTLNVVPLIAALRQKAETIRLEETEKMLAGSRLGQLSARELKAVDNLTRLIVNRILKEPVLRIKEFAVEGNSDDYVASLCQLFDLEGEFLPEGKSRSDGSIHKMRNGARST